MDILVCPKCLKNDAIQKISAINRLGIASTEYDSVAPITIGGKTSYIPVTRKGRVQSELSGYFSPPSQDLKKLRNGLKSNDPDFIKWKKEFNMYLILWFALGVIPAFMYRDSGFTVLVGFLIIALIILFIILVVYTRNRAREFEAKYETVDQKFLRNALERWERSYYCSRCDVIFDEKERKSFDISNYHSFLWR